MRTIHRDIVGGYVFSKDGKLLLGKNRKGGVYEGSFGVPGGGVENGETNEIALRREIEEETGIDINNSKISSLRTAFGVNKKTLQNTGERVLVKITFFDFRIDIDQKASEILVKTDSDWHKHHWFDANELNEINLADPTKIALIEMGIIGR
ncbi:MAG: NUDIX hydrolase [bacterium]